MIICERLQKTLVIRETLMPRRIAPLKGTAGLNDAA